MPQIASHFQYNHPIFALLESRSEVVCNLPSQCVRLVSFISCKKLRVDEFVQYVVNAPSIVVATENGLVVPGAFSIPILDDIQGMLDQYMLISAHKRLSFTVVHVLENSDDSLVLEPDVDEEVWNPVAASIVVESVGLDHGDEDGWGESAFGVA